MTVVNQAPATHEPTPSVLRSLLDAQRAAFDRQHPRYRQRIDALRALREALDTYREDLAHAVSADFGGRAREETFLLELFPLLDAIRHATRHLKSWMKPRRVGSAWYLLPSRAYIVHQLFLRLVGRPIPRPSSASGYRSCMPINQERWLPR